MNIKEIQELIRLMHENNIDEFQLERNGFKIVLKRGQTYVESHAPASQQASVPPSVVARERVEAAPEKKFIEIVSPMVGTFYGAPSPDSAPYAPLNQQVRPGDVVCIIEAMKVMNEIKSEVSGSVVEVLVENGQPVEYGQPLFRLQPLGD